MRLLSERMRQRVAALEAALQQLEPNRREVEYDDETRRGFSFYEIRLQTL